MKLNTLALAIALIALAPFSSRAQTTTIQPSVLAASGGRFVFGQISSFRSDQYMLDTQTGRLWRIVVDKNEQPLLEPVTYKGLDGTHSLVPPNPDEELARVAAKFKKIQEEQEKAEAKEKSEAQKPKATDK